jgi:head-tail adaptor
MKDGLSMKDPLMDEFVRAYEEMAAEVERIVVQYPNDMRDDLRAHAQEVLRVRLQEMWTERQRQAKSS